MKHQLCALSYLWVLNHQSSWSVSYNFGKCAYHVFITLDQCEEYSNKKMNDNKHVLILYIANYKHNHMRDCSSSARMISRIIPQLWCPRVSIKFNRALNRFIIINTHTHTHSFGLSLLCSTHDVRYIISTNYVCIVVHLIHVFWRARKKNKPTINRQRCFLLTHKHREKKQHLSKLV